MISLTPEKALIFRVTHYSNVPWILDHGLHSRNSSEFDPNYCEIGNPDLIAKRSLRDVPIPPGGTLSDYIPFYFTPFSPMLYNIKTGHNGIKQTPMSDIVIFVTSLRKLAELGLPLVFTDRHAYLQTANFYSDLSHLNDIDWRIIQSRDFKRNPEDRGKFERYQAEALIHRHLPVTALVGLACHDGEREIQLNAEVEKRRLSLKIVVRHDWYF